MSMWVYIKSSICHWFPKKKRIFHRNPDSNKTEDYDFFTENYRTMEA